MASIAQSLKRINQELDLFLPLDQIHQACRDAGYRFRQCKLCPSLTVHLLILQLLASVSFRGLRRVARILPTKQAIAQARARLPLAALLQLVQMLCQRVTRDPAGERWFGHRLVLIDGTCSHTPDSPQLRQKYGKGKNQRGTSLGYPVVKLLALMNYSTGLLYKVIAMPWRLQEKSFMACLFRYLKPSDMVLADRGLVSFAHLALLLQRKLCFCICLPKSMIVHGRGNTSHRRLRRLGRQDLLVTWLRVRRPPWMSLFRFATLPATLKLRQIAFRLCRPGFRPNWIWIITDRLDPVLYPAKALIELYRRRWQIEVDFRDLKNTLQMTKLRSRTADGVRKELAAFVILYNLVRMTMLEAAWRQKVPPDRISFIDAADWLLWSEPGDVLGDLEVNPRRRRRTQPRQQRVFQSDHPPDDTALSDRCRLAICPERRSDGREPGPRHRGALPDAVRRRRLGQRGIPPQWAGTGLRRPRCRQGANANGHGTLALLGLSLPRSMSGEAGPRQICD